MASKRTSTLRKLTYGLLASGLLLCAFGAGGETERRLLARPTSALGVMACGKLYAIVLLEANGKVTAVTPSLKDADRVAAIVAELPKEQQSVVTLEVKCAQPDTTT